MKKKNILTIILIIVIVLFKINVEAATCTSEEKSALKQEARMLEIIPVLENEEDEWHEYSYGVSFINWNKDFYIVDTNDVKYYKSDSYQPDDIYGQYAPGTAETFKVYARYGTKCAFEHLVTIRVTFEHYNHYYLSPLCDGIEEFNLCQRTYSGKIESAEWFEQEVTKYKRSLEEKPEEKELTILEQVQKYIRENPAVIVVVVVITILIIVIVIRHIKSSKKRIKVNLDLK